MIPFEGRNVKKKEAFFPGKYETKDNRSIVGNTAEMFLF